MNYCKCKFLIYLFLVVMPAVSFAGTFQGVDKKDDSPKKILRKAQKNTKNGEYEKARENYLKLIGIDSVNFDYNFELGLNYFYTFDNRAKAVEYFETALKYSPKDTLGQLYYYLGGAYQYMSRLEEAIASYTYFKRFIKKNKDGKELNKDVNIKIAECHQGKAFATSVDKKVKIENLGLNVNSKYADYVPVIDDDESILMFTSRRNSVNAKTDYNDEKYYEDMFISRKKNNEFSPAQQFNVEDTYVGYIPNTPFHDAVIGVSADGKSLFTYRDNRLWLSELKNDSTWEGPAMLNENINVKKGYQSHAYLVKDGSVLYFTSDKRGGFGGIDLYKSTKQTDGTWGPAENLGPNINTKFNEDSPYLSTDEKTLYFSSKGHNSMGGYDIFKSDYINGQWTAPENMGRPINSSSDDIFYIFNQKDGNKAYFSSSRPEGLGDMDIYRITFLAEPEFTACDLISANSNDNNNSKYIHFTCADTVMIGQEVSFDASGSKVKDSKIGNIYWNYGDGNTAENAVGTHKYNDKGVYEVKMELQAFHETKLTTDNYCVKKQLVVISENEMEELLAAKNKVTDTTAIASSELKGSIKILLENVYFDFDKFGISENEKNTLDKNIEMLKGNPDITFSVIAYTDSKGSDTYNKRLSERRARATANYLVKNGISRKRIIEAKGLGETSLKNQCSDDIECSDEEHRLNRRTEFVIGN